MTDLERIDVPAPARAISPKLILGAAICTVLLGIVGLLIAAEAALLVLPSPRDARRQGWRLLALAALTTGLTTGLVGAVAFGSGDLRGHMETPAQSIFGFFEGGVLFGAPGLALGALVGTVLAMDHWRQERRATRRGDTAEDSKPR